MNLSKPLAISLFLMTIADIAIAVEPPVNKAQASVTNKNEVTTRIKGSFRYIKSNGYPKSAGVFPSPANPYTMVEQRYHFRMYLRPKLRGYTMPVAYKFFGVRLDGIPFDGSSRDFWRNDRHSGWNYETFTPSNLQGLDVNLGHVSKTGAYHYHALSKRWQQKAKALANGKQPSMLLVGFAADGFPIYAGFGYQSAMDKTSAIVELNSSYQLKSGKRPMPPGGSFDGTFIEDYQYVAGGPLDACNGRRGVTAAYPNGTYYYVLTKNFPFIPRCFVGFPDKSFDK